MCVLTAFIQFLIAQEFKKMTVLSNPGLQRLWRFNPFFFAVSWNNKGGEKMRNQMKHRKLLVYFIETEIWWNRESPYGMTKCARGISELWDWCVSNVGLRVWSRSFSRPFTYAHDVEVFQRAHSACSCLKSVAALKQCNHLLIFNGPN
jgi:hypothetical protein